MAFRLDAIIGPIVRLGGSEQITVYSWELRVRQRFAMDCKTDALPLSSMLIKAKATASASATIM